MIKSQRAPLCDSSGVRDTATLSRMQFKILSNLVLVLVFASSAWACGKERWTIKVLRDNPRLQYRGPVTVTQLRALQRPADLHQRSQAETAAVTVDAVLLAFKLENGEDIHLVLGDPNNRVTMIGEIPSPHCGRQSEAKYYTAARNFIAQIAGPIPSVGTLKTLQRPIAVRLRGVVFFDFLHHQTGVAPNGIELHPVLIVARP